jgi:hypothetical protein
MDRMPATDDGTVEGPPREGMLRLSRKSPTPQATFSFYTAMTLVRKVEAQVIEGICKRRWIDCDALSIQRFLLLKSNIGPALWDLPDWAYQIVRAQDQKLL